MKGSWRGFELESWKLWNCGSGGLREWGIEGVEDYGIVELWNCGIAGLRDCGSEGVEESLVASRLRLDDVAGSRLARRGGPRTAAHGGAQAKGTAAAREANIAKTADAVRDGRGKTRAWQGAKAHSEAEPPMRRSQATRIADDRRGSGDSMRGFGSGRSGTEGFQMSRVAQDCTPSLIWRLASGCKDAQVGHIKA